MKQTVLFWILAALLPAAAAQPALAPRLTAPAQVPAPTQPARNYVAVGAFYYGQGDYARAFVAYDTAVRANPTNVDALLGLGRTQIRLGDPQAAVTSLRRATELSPTNVSGYVALSQAHSLAFRQAREVRTADIQLGPATGGESQLALALAALEQAEAQLPRLPAAQRSTEASKIWNERGYVLRLQAQTDAALAAFREAHRLNPGESVILFNLAETQAGAGDLSAATSTIQKAVLTNPRDALNRAYFARLLAQQGNFAVARPQAAMAAQLAPQNAYVAGQYGVVSYLAREPLTARTQLQKALQLAPTAYPEFSYYLGRLELDAGDLRAARQALTVAADLGQLPEAFYFLGLSLERRSSRDAAQPQQAAQAYRSALALRPDYPEARDGLARVTASSTPQ